MNEKTLGLDELMIVNPSPLGGKYMLNRPIYGSPLGMPPEAFDGMASDYAQYPEDVYEGWGQPPGEFITGYGQHPEEDLGCCGQYPEEDMGDFAQFAQQEDGYGQYMPDEMDDFASGEDAAMGYYDQVPEEDLGLYAQYPEDEFGEYGQYPESDLEGYQREIDPPFNPRGDFGTQLAGYQSEKSVNPTCDFTRQADDTPAVVTPAFFRPYF